MNITTLHSKEKPVSALSIFKGTDGTATSLQILAGQLLKEHITKVPALLICITGKAVFENEQGMKEELASGDYIHIEPMVKHWVSGIEDSQLLLIK
ncbi:MAG: hypothetical protein IPM42_02005 [Saprospiraceae bacterium]|nr:hypothetical protein [Saprospiraceae bacterium]